MTVKELIEKLQKANQNAEVVFNNKKHAYSVYIVSEDTRKRWEECVDVCVLECEKEKSRDEIPLRYDHIL